MTLEGVKSVLVSVKEATTLEPMIFLLWVSELQPSSVRLIHSSPLKFGHMLVYGAGVGVDLLILKICRYEIGFNETVCDNLKEPRFNEFEAEVNCELINPSLG